MDLSTFPGTLIVHSVSNRAIFYQTSELHCQGAGYTHAHSNLVEPRSLIGERVSWAFGPERLYIVSRNSTLPELKNLYAYLVHALQVHFHF